MKIYRQGDVLLVRVKSIPKGAALVPRGEEYVPEAQS